MAYRLAANSDSPLVFFDIEGTGLIRFDYMPDIIQLAAVDQDGDVFNRYTMPTKSLTASALTVTGIRIQDGQMLRHGSPLETHPLKDVLKDFLHWLDQIATSCDDELPILLAYNGTKYDFQVLRNGFESCGLQDEAKRKIGGFADVFKMALDHIPKREVGNYQLKTLARKYSKGAKFDAHNAIDDAKALKVVYETRLGKKKLNYYKIPY